MKKTNISEIIDNEREWRRYLLERISDLEKDIGALKIRVAAISSIMGALVSLGVSWVTTKLGV